MGYKIIIIDDNQANKDLIGHLLTKAENSGVIDFNNYPHPVPVAELLSRIKKSLELFEFDHEIDKRIQRTKEDQ